MYFSRFAVALLAATLTVKAQQQPSNDTHFVRASANAVVTAKPDRAQISIGVQTQASTASAAAEHNASQTVEVIKEIRAVLGSNGQIQTTNYSISPHYEISNGSSHQNGFETSNTVQVTVDDLTLLPRLLDASTASGANNIGGISFSIKDDSQLRIQALAEASRKAKEAAEGIAQALDLRVVGVANAESDVSSPPIRPMMAMALSRKVATTPIETDSIDVRASVTVTLEVTP